jgi:hypothetical protein
MTQKYFRHPNLRMTATLAWRVQVRTGSLCTNPNDANDCPTRTSLFSTRNGLLFVGVVTRERGAENDLSSRGTCQTRQQQ